MPDLTPADIDRLLELDARAMAAPTADNLGAFEIAAMQAARPLAERVRELEAESARLGDLLLRFRDFVVSNAAVWAITTSRGEPTNHHNPIWAEVADALAQKEERS